MKMSLTVALVGAVFLAALVLFCPTIYAAQLVAEFSEQTIPTNPMNGAGSFTFNDFGVPGAVIDGPTSLTFDVVDSDAGNGVFGGIGVDYGPFNTNTMASDGIDFDPAMAYWEVRLKILTNNAATAMRTVIRDMDIPGVSGDEHVFEFDLTAVPNDGQFHTLTKPFTSVLFTQGAFGFAPGDTTNNPGMNQIQIQSVFGSAGRLNIEVDHAQIWLTTTSPEVSLASFDDHFLGTTLDPGLWQKRGPKTLTVSNSYVNIADDGNNWDHGEVDTVPPFAIPGPGESTEITWVLGPGAVTTPSTNSAISLGYTVGIVSANEPSGWTYQPYNSSEGGIWCELGFEHNITNGVGGNLYFANATKQPDTNVGIIQLVPLGIANWNWQIENRAITLRLTDIAYFWYDGTNLLGAGSWDQAGLDAEFVDGYHILGVGRNYNAGRSSSSIDRISATSITTDFAFTNIAKGSSVTVAWGPVYPGGTYDVDRAPYPDGPWTNLAGNLDSNAYTDTSATSNEAVYRVSLNLSQGCGLLGAGFEAGEDLSAWTENVYAGTNVWEVGVPTDTNGPGSAFLGSNVYGTVLAGPYPGDPEAGLRTPVIDLAGLTQATLTFWHWHGLEDGQGFGEIWLLDSGGSSILVGPAVALTGESGGWVHYVLPLPSEAFTAGQIKVEFRLFNWLANDLDYPGWFIDEVCIEGQ